MSNAQIPCLGVDVFCVNVPAEPATYKCIDASSPKTFGQLIADGLLLDPITSASTPQRLIIRGSVIVDYNNSGWPDEYVFAPGSEIVLVSTTGSMTINPGKTLHLNNTSVHGCIFLWKEILVKSGASLKVDNSSEIKDAFAAIKAEPGSSLSVINSQFRGNFVSMELGDKNATSAGSVTILSGGAISGNVFEGIDILKPNPILLPNPTNIDLRPYRGIELWNLNSLNVGQNTGGGNIFKNFKNVFDQIQFTASGILAFNSTAVIRNTVFQNMCPSSTNGRDGAITAFDNSNIDVKGLINSYTFENCHSSIYTSNSSLSLADASARAIKFGVTCIQVNVGTAKSISIENCSFEEFAEQAVHVRSSAGPLFLSNLKVLQCSFDDNSDVDGTNFGVLVSASAPSTINSMRIENNDFYFRQKPQNANNAFWGIKLNNVFGGNVKNNTMLNYATQGAFSNIEFRGIDVSAGGGTRFYNNTITGTGTGFSASYGINVAGSIGNYIGCNTVSTLSYGIRFNDLCLNTKLYANDFDDYHSQAGLYLDEGAVISQQNKNLNQWPGTSSAKEAFMFFPGYDPNDNMDKFQVKLSEMIIHTSNQGNFYWSDPRIVGEVSATTNDPNWFVSSPDPNWPPQIIQCPSTFIEADNELDFGEQSLIAGTFYPYRGFESSTWDAAFFLYGRLSADSMIRPTGSTAASWYVNSQNTSYGKMWEVFEGYRRLTSGETQPPAPLSLLNTLSSITDTTLHEQNMKTVLSNYLDMVLNETSPSSMEDMEMVAAQCRFSGGYGVLLARVMLNQDISQNQDTCQGSQSSQRPTSINDATHLKEQVSIFPSPASDFIIVKLEDNLSNGELALLDSNGSVLKNLKFSGNSAEVILQGLNSGAYILVVRDSDREVARKKISVIR